MARGGWGVSPVDDFYRYRDGDRVVDPERSAAARAEDIEQALTAGFTGFRIVADATAVVRRPEQVEAFARYEYLLDRAMATLPARALCAHDRRSGARPGRMMMYLRGKLCGAAGPP